MKKGIIAVFFAVTFLAVIGTGCKKSSKPTEPGAPTPVEEPAEKRDNGFIYRVENGEVTILGMYAPIPKAAVIPTDFEGATVTKIAANAFKDLSDIEFVVIPDSVTTIGERAFEGTSLIAAWLPTNAPATGANAFPVTATLYVPYTTGNIPDTYTSAIANVSALPLSITSQRFTSYTGTESFAYLPPTVNGVAITTIGNQTFRLNTTIEEVFAPGLIFVETGEAIHSPYKGSFLGCTSLTVAQLPFVTTIDRAFEFCSNLLNADFPLVTNIGEATFYECVSLTNANMPLAVTIKSGAFARCRELTSVYFPNATYLGNYSFQNCSNLVTAEFAALTNMISRTFEHCINFMTLTINNSTPPIIGSDAFYNTPTNKTLRVPAGAESNYHSWKAAYGFANIVAITP